MVNARKGIRKLLDKYDNAYYNEGNSLVTDAEYDDLRARLSVEKVCFFWGEGSLSFEWSFGVQQGSIVFISLSSKKVGHPPSQGKVRKLFLDRLCCISHFFGEKETELHLAPMLSLQVSLGWWVLWLGFFLCPKASHRVLGVLHN